LGYAPLARFSGAPRTGRHAAGAAPARDPRRAAARVPAMKKDTHPLYHPVVFKDLSNGQLIVTRSTMTSEQKVRLSDGNEYPVIPLEITNMSHPFYTGEQRLIDTQGRVDKFKKRYGR
jgi:large subunit ribosomal protein L31